ncbi:MAG: hypothetical protein WBM17_14870, partial [Anaerolineales bacterium]
RQKLGTVRSEVLLPALWLALNLVLLYAPFSLQRRLMLGMWIPLAALAAPKLEGLLFRPAFHLRYAVYAAIPLFAANLVFLSAIRINALGHNPLIFLSPDSAAAFDWLNANARGSVVLASPENSAWLPGMAGARVVYGHGMETPDAGQALRDVEAFFTSSDEDLRTRILTGHQVDLVLCSMDQPACTSSEDGMLVEVFSSGNVRIFAVQNK